MTPPRSVAPSDAELLALIDQLGGVKGQPPSVRDLMRAVGLASPGSTHRHIQRLRRAGLVRPDRLALVFQGKKQK